MTKKDTIMKTLLDSGASVEDLKWANSHLPNTNDLGGAVQGFDFNKVIIDHSRKDVLECLGITRKEEKALIRRIEDIGDRLSSKDNKIVATKLVQDLLPTLSEKEVCLLLVRACRTVFEPSNPIQPSPEGFLDFLDKIRRLKKDMENDEDNDES